MRKNSSAQIHWKGMMIIMKYRKVLNFIFIAFLGVIISLSSYFISFVKVKNYYENDYNMFKSIDILNTIFISKNYKAIDYLDNKDIMLLLIPISFLLVGFIIGSMSFLSKPKEYNCFVCSRAKTYDKSMKFIYGKPIVRILIYSISYFITLLFIFSENYGFEKDIFIYLFSLCISRILIIMFIVRLSFVIFESCQSSTAVVCGLITIILLYLLNMSLTGINLVLFDPKVYSVLNIPVIICLIIITKVIERIINHRRNFYVY